MAIIVVPEGQEKLGLCQLIDIWVTMDSQVAQYYTMQLQKGRHIERTRSFGAI